jgi:hypothetical protein
MTIPELWLRLVREDDPGVTYPRLGHGAGESRRDYALSDRARWLLAAIALPRELTPAIASDEAQRRRLGSLAWSSGEIMARIPYQHRSTLKHALGDLRVQLTEDGLELEDYLEIDTRRGRYALHPGRVRVDLVDLYTARDDPEAFDRLLAAEVAEPERARLAPICHELLQGPIHAALSQELAASGRRAREVASDDRADASAPQPTRPPPRPRRFRIWVPAAAAVTAAILAGIVFGSSNSHAHSGRGRVEVAGGLAHTWSDPRQAGGRQSRPLRGGERVTIACRMRGFAVQDGDVWWYRLADAPWSGSYYATADAFYNNGRTSGSLIGSRLVDLRIPVC